MMSKVVYLLVVLCAFQHVQSAGPQKRGLIDDLMNVVGSLEQKIESALSTVQDGINNAKQLASQIFNSLTQNVQQAIQNAKDEINSAVNKAVQAGKNVTACVGGQFDALQKIGAQAGPDFQNCIQAQVANLDYIMKDIVNLKQQELELAAGIPSGFASCSINPVCMFNYFTATAAKFTLLTSSVSNDLVKFAKYTGEMGTKSVQCGKDELTKITSQIGNTVSTTISCIQNGPASS
ncbi:uncharacterized protein [Periplaneta americana]|uniref:uncharacterized protein n=1 Tax=Periplaneta americana TaxID=6978 RepID=UPI0037E8ED51